MWNKFIIGYCKVDFLCFNNDPNWFGWGTLIFLGLFLFGFLCIFLNSIDYE